MTTFDVVQNNTGSTVAAPYTPGSGTLQLADASAFPTSYPYRLSLFAPDGSPKSILAVTGRVGNVLAVGSALEGTADVSLSVGDLARLRVTAGALQDVHTAINNLEGAVATYGDVVTHNAAEFGSAATLANHTANTSNPHSTTATQVGAYTTTQVDTLLAGKQAAGSYVPETRTVAGHALSTNVTVTASDVGLGSVTNDAQLKASQLVTTLGNPGTDGNVPSEKAVRAAISAGGSGTVSSVALTMPTGFSVANSPVTTTGTLAVTTALSGFVKASAGAFTAGTIAAGDIPDISATYVPVTRTVAGHALSGNVSVTASDVGLGSVTNDAQLKASQLVTSVGTPGSDTNVPSEKSVRTALAAISAGSTDLVSPLTAAEIAVTGATTLTLDRMHVCSGTSANYTVTLPAVTGNAGKIVGVRMSMALTKLVTLDAGSGVAIDGQRTRVMWAGETAFLMCDGTNWAKISGRTRSLMALLRLETTGDPATAQSIGTATMTKVLLNVMRADNSGLMADTSNHQINIVRTSSYTIIASILYANVSAATDRCLVRCFINGGENFGGEAYSGAAGAPSPNSTGRLDLTVGDAVDMRTYLVGVTGNLFGSASTNASFLCVAEEPSW